MSERGVVYETRINEDGSLTIPLKILKEVGIVPNSRIVILFDGEKLVLQSAILYYLAKLQESVLEETGNLKFEKGMNYFQSQLPNLYKNDCQSSEIGKMLLSEFRELIKD